jgi:hypothetical protein
MVYSNTQSSTPAGNGVALGNRAEIIPSTPLPELNGVGGPAFAARIKNESTSDLMAILCNTGMAPRIDIVTAVRSIDHSSMLRLVDNGVVHWPSDDMRYFAFALQRPTAPRMMASIDEQRTPMTEDALNHYFVTPMIGVLNELMRTGVAHNAIRPDNIFWRIGGASPPQLGECISAPPGVGQPVLFEPLERAMSTPMGRGAGTHADDCYAFGVTLALLILGQNPMQGMDDNAIIQMKIERGSFNAMTNNRRLSATHIELLRGLLTDDAGQRWSAADLDQWMNGRRLTPKNSDAGRRAPRHIDFAGKQYWHLRPLAAALAQNVHEGVAAIESGAIDKWLRRAMGDEERANNVSDAKNSLKASGKTAHYEEQLIARTCIALDPSGPIRYRGLSVMPSGIANMLVEAMMTGHHIQALSEIIASQLVTFWVDLQKEVKTEFVPLAQQYERMRGVIEKTTFGNGIERATYELNTGLPCLSPMLRPQYVTTPKALLPALERVASSGNRPNEPLDRHIAAFLIVRDRRSENMFAVMSTSDNPAQRGLALLTLYSEVQSRHGPESAPNFAQWLLPLIEPSIQRYLGKNLREKMQKEIRDVASRGDLAALLRLVDDPKRIEYDRQEFMAARMLYLNIMKEVAGIEYRLANRNLVVESTGKPMAASISSFLAILFIIVTILRAILQSLLR